MIIIYNFPSRWLVQFFFNVYSKESTIYEKKNTNIFYHKEIKMHFFYYIGSWKNWT